MKATLVLIYKVLGASRLADGFSKGPVYDSGAVVAHLTENVDKAWEHVDRANALVGLLLGSFKGQRLGSEDQVEKPESDLVSREMAIERERRLKEHGSGVFLTISAAKDVGEPLLNATRLMGEFGIALDAIDKNQLRTSLDPSINAILAAVALSLPDNAEHQIKKAGQAVYLHAEQPLYAVDFELGTPRLSVGSAFDVDRFNEIGATAKALSKQEKLVRSLRLHVLGNSRDTDPLLAFIAAWSGLEIFTATMFKERYNAQWYRMLSSATPAAAGKVIERFEEVMADKLRLADKFGVIASILNPHEAEKDIADFNAMKKRRDDYFHALEGSQDRYPTDDILRLHRKYLNLHLQSSKT